jgi:hypothetical protein
MAADHASICKFEDPKGPDYTQILGNLQNLVEGAIKAVGERERLKDPSLPVASILLAKPCK